LYFVARLKKSTSEGMIHLSEIKTYPTKSTAGQSHRNISVESKGLKYDRKWLLLDEQGQMITGREHQRLLKIEASVQENRLEVRYEEEALDISFDQFSEPFQFQLWKQPVSGLLADESINQWLSQQLDINCTLVHQALEHRTIPQKTEELFEGPVNYADQAPILLVSSASIRDLNGKLKSPVTTDHFRPNLAVENEIPFEEEDWKSIAIGECVFDVIESCKRCVFITIDPKTLEKSPDQEPLRTLAKYRQHPRGGVSFGIHLIPRQIGKIKLEDEIRILK